ncbi:head maturation protease, ClpP-related [Paenibacillus sp. GCM10012307]|uniref:ATP-dependent Clp protease proteolytic subunit n=1 Tax=Paenibacillus roseus TaxID=2798579 RepID=A0A934J810_9BACL|nr:head maturation protease, ClpP-related [Paenibacillus roseus]MBJ6362107.1 Clp protease ClpP [Paenibacillus roseus]
MIRIDVSGRIIRNNEQPAYDYYGYDATSPGKVRKMLQEAGGQPIEVYFNSPGGDVYAGAEIFTELREYKGESVGKIPSIAASAASVAAMGVKKLLISPPAQLMIHNAATGTWGDKNEHQLTLDMLNVTDRAIANAYIFKTRKKQDEILNLMSKTTFFTADDAVKHGFADGVMFEAENQFSAVASLHDEGELPVRVIEKFQNEIINLIPNASKGEDDSMSNNQIQPPTNAVPPSVPVAVPPLVAASVTPVSTVAPQAASNPPVAPVATIDFAAQERLRLQAIDAIAANIDQELVNEAKYINPITAEQLAFKAMKEGKLLNAGLFQEAVEANRAAGTEAVQPQALSQSSDQEFDLKNLGDVNQIFNALASQSQQGRPHNIQRR